MKSFEYEGVTDNMSVNLSSIPANGGGSEYFRVSFSFPPIRLTCHRQVLANNSSHTSSTILVRLRTLESITDLSTPNIRIHSQRQRDRDLLSASQNLKLRVLN